MSRKRVTSLRISEYTEAQIEQLGAMMQSSNNEVILIAIDRMYRQEIGGNPLKKEEPMKTYYVQESMLGSEATPEQAKRMVELLRERGYEAEYGFDFNTFFSPMSDLEQVWDECLDIISREHPYGAPKYGTNVGH